MPQTLPKDTPLTRLNTVQPRMVKVQADVVDPLIDVNQPEILDLIAAALADCRMKHSYAAARAGVKESQFSTALNGQGNFGARWLWAQEDRFLLRFCELLMEARQLTPAAASALRRRRIVELIDLLLQESA